MLTAAHVDRFVVGFAGVSIAYAVYVLSKRTMHKRDACETFISIVVILVTVLSTYRVLEWWDEIQSVCLDPSSTPEYTVHDYACLRGMLVCQIEKHGKWKDETRSCVHKLDTPRVVVSQRWLGSEFDPRMFLVTNLDCTDQGGKWDSVTGICSDASDDAIEYIARDPPAMDDVECQSTAQEPAQCFTSDGGYGADHVAHNTTDE